MPLTFNAFTGTLDYVGTGGGGTATPGGPNGAVQFNSAGTFGGDAAFTWDSVNKRVGIGIATGILAQVHTLLDVAAGGNSQHALFDQYNASNVTGPLVIGRRSRGTSSVPAAVQAGDQLFTLTARGDDGAGFVAGGRGNMLFAAAELWTATANGTLIDFNTTLNGTIAVSSVTPRLRIADDGSILVNTPTKIAGSKVVVTGGALHVLAGNALRLQGAGAGFTSFVDPTHAANIAYTLPTAQATVAGQVLTNDATGVLSWATAGAGTASGDLSGTYPGPITVTRINGGLLGTTTPVTQGDLLVADATPSFARFGGNATATRNYLSMTSSVPLWTAIPGTDVTGAALTTVNDTNVTLTLGGTPATALLRAASLTLGWLNQLAVGRGGTGLASGTSGGILGFTGPTTLASSTLLTANALVLGGGAAATPSTPVGLGTTTTVLHGNAAGAPSFGSVVLTSGVTQDVTGTLPIGNGGTGQVTALAAFNALSPLTTAGDLLTFSGGNNVRLPYVVDGRYFRGTSGAPAWVDPLLFDDFTQYTKRTGRTNAPIGNDTLLSLDGNGTLTGSAVAAGNLNLNATSSGTPGIIVIQPNVTNIPAAASFSALQFSNTIAWQLNSLFAGALDVEGTWSFPADFVSDSFLFKFGTVLQNSPSGTSRNIGNWGGLAYFPGFTTQGTATTTVQLSTAVADEPTFQRAALGGVVVCADHTTILSQPAVGVACSLTQRRFVHFANRVGTGTQGNVIVLDIDAQTATGQKTSLRCADTTMDIRHAGPLRLGSSSAGPTGGSILQFDGGLTVKVSGPIDADYTVLTTDFIIQFSTLTATRVVNLPSVATTPAGKVYIIVKNTASASDLTVTPNGTEKIDGAASKGVGTAGFSAMRIYSTGVSGGAGSEWKTF